MKHHASQLDSHSPTALHYISICLRLMHCMVIERHFAFSRKGIVFDYTAFLEKNRAANYA